MNTFRFASITLTTLCLMTVGQQEACAAITYDLAIRPSGESASLDDTLTVSPGAILGNAEIVLIETVVGGSESILGGDELVAGNRSGNLFSARANLNSSGADGSISNLQTITDGGGLGVSADQDTIHYLALGVNLFQPGLNPTQIDTSTWEVVLGTVDINAPTVGTTEFRIEEFGDDADFGTFSNGSLELAATSSGGSFNSRSLSITAIPEPSFAAALGISMLLYGCRRRTRHQRRSGDSR